MATHGGSLPGGDDANRRRRRREQTPSTIPALFPRGGGAANALPGRTPTQYPEDRATTPIFFVMGVRDLVESPPSNPFSRLYRTEPESSNISLPSLSQGVCKTPWGGSVSRVSAVALFVSTLLRNLMQTLHNRLEPPKQPFISSIPYSPLEKTHSTQAPRWALAHSFSSSSPVAFLISHYRRLTPHKLHGRQWLTPFLFHISILVGIVISLTSVLNLV